MGQVVPQLPKSDFFCLLLGHLRLATLGDGMWNYKGHWLISTGSSEAGPFSSL